MGRTSSKFQKNLTPKTAFKQSPIAKTLTQSQPQMARRAGKRMRRGRLRIETNLPHTIAGVGTPAPALRGSAAAALRSLVLCSFGHIMPIGPQNS
jgi:hypothetical protein